MISWGRNVTNPGTYVIRIKTTSSASMKIAHSFVNSVTDTLAMLTMT